LTVHWEILEDPVIIGRLILQLFLFAGSALFSMSETALFSLRETDLQRLDTSRASQARRIRDLLAEPRQLIVSILCGNELINIAATINLAGILLALLGDPQAAAIANTVVMLPLLLVLGEITPKTVAVTKPVSVSTGLVEPVISTWVHIAMPLRTVVRFAADQVTNLIIGAGRDERNILSGDEFRTLLTDVEAEGVVNAAEHRVILNLIEAGDAKLDQIMVPRPRIAFIDANMPVPEILERFRMLRHRRVPIYRDRRDNLLGVIKEERVLDLVARKPVAEIRLDELIEPAALTPPTQTIASLAEFFKDGDHHAALVVNEFGGVEGLVTADDVFGFLTQGEPAHLAAHAKVEQRESGVIRCVGLTPIRALNRAANLALPDDADFATVGGLIMALLNRGPTPGDSVAEAGLTLKVLSMDGLLVDQVEIAPEMTEDAQAAVPSLEGRIDQWAN